MMDLIYCQNQAEQDKLEKLIKDNIPQVEIRDASDDIHMNRFEVHVIDQHNELYLLFMLRNFAYNSFKFNTATGDDKFYAYILSLVQRIKQEDEQHRA